MAADANAKDLENQEQEDETNSVNRGDVLDEGDEEDENKSAAPGEEEEEKETEDEDEREKRSDRRKVIPLDRHTAVLEKERAAREAAEARLAAAEQKLVGDSREAEVAKRLEGMEAQASELAKQHSHAVIEGDEEKASEIMRSIRKLDREIVRLEQSSETERQTAAVMEQSRVDIAIAKLEAEYPEFNTESPSFDESLTSFVISEQQRLIRAEGLSPSKALYKAADYVVRRFLMPDEEKEGAKRGLKAQGDRKKEAVERNLAAAKRQPASMKEAGANSDKKGKGGDPDPTRMTVEEFDALPEATRARLRGDFL
ncbi:MAG: hypothetical protein LBJ46_07455 [Planctomycetota bacterium]|jgi:hypothetical protein|nr:hypothetical protein [Planctomycetota bacterium]